MANLDISRHLLDRRKHYTGARMQQGRSLLDSDWNEDARLEAEELRQTLVELLGVQGSSNAGFAVGNVQAATVPAIEDGQLVESYDFDLHAGSFFVGGVRLQVDEGGETFLKQVDWLQLDRGAWNLPQRPTLQSMLPPELADPDPTATKTSGPGTPPSNPRSIEDYLSLPISTRCDLVYLEAWEQPVTAVEDAELRERGLGGPDSTARIRRMRRIHVAPGLSTDKPEAALAEVMGVLEAEGVGSFDTSNNEFISGATLTVTPITDAVDLCSPTPPGGYIGHEDQALRIELRDKNSIVWGFCNGAPLYRVEVGAGLRKLTFLNKPNDLPLQPKAGQLVEIIAWGSKLPNDEKAAELTGELRRVETSYDPATGELVLKDPLPTAMLDWFDVHAAEHVSPRDGEHGRYLYLRLWDRGGDLSSEDTIRMDEVVPLGNTGLQLRLSGQGRVGDYWIIAARRATPKRVVPWQLLSAAPPMGPRRFYAPLAMLCWELPVRILESFENIAASDPPQVYVLTIPGAPKLAWGPVRAKVTDGRRQLEKLCAGGCCTITVGNGGVSEGMVNSLQDAIDLVPDGGRICLLRGDHDVAVTMTGRKNITIEGCGRDCRLVNTTPVVPTTDLYEQGVPLLTLTDCEGITLRDFALQANSRVGVKIEGSPVCRDITLDGLRFAIWGSYDFVPNPNLYALPQAAVYALGGDGLTIRRCEVIVWQDVMDPYNDMVSFTPALVVGGSRMRLHDNYVRAGALDYEGVVGVMGGIHILSQSSDVRVERNEILGGWGHGVALGHMVEVNLVATTLEIDESNVWSMTTRALGDVVSNLRGWAPGNESPTTMPTINDFWNPAGSLVDVHVCNNRIRGMGLSGVSTGGFVDAARDGKGSRFIVVVDLEVSGNEIRGNVQIQDLPVPRFLTCDIAVGGVALAAGMGVRIHGNRICENYNKVNLDGSAWNTPIAGIACVAVQGLSIEDNQIADNGLEYPTPNETFGSISLRGGVVVCELSAIRGYTFEDGIHDGTNNVTVVGPSFSLRSNLTALVMRKNQVRHQVGKALWVLRGFGPISVCENSLHGRGDPIAGIAIPKSEICYQKDLATVINYPAQGACVEIRNYATNEDVDYTGGTVPGPTLVDKSVPAVAIPGGETAFIANEVELDWQWKDGYCASVLLSSLDSVTVTNNVMAVRMHSPFAADGHSSLGAEHINDIIAGLPGDSFSYVFVNCWAGARLSVQASGNRFEEGQFDALFSCLARHAAAFDSSTPASALTETIADSLVVANAASHCVYPANGDSAVEEYNAVVQEVIPGCGGTVSYSDNGGAKQTVCITIIP